MEGNFIELYNLEVYRISKSYSTAAWPVYSQLTWEYKKIIGDQMIRSIDSVGANIAEGYGRFHYLDKIKFYYIARGSLVESAHWLELMIERKMFKQEDCVNLLTINKQIYFKLNGLIKSQHERKATTTNT